MYRGVSAISNEHHMTGVLGAYECILEAGLNVNNNKIALKKKEHVIQTEFS